MDACNRGTDRADPRFWLSASRVSLLSTELLADDRLLTLAVDDALWTFALQDWASRQPSAWRRMATRRWYAEGQRIIEERERLQATATVFRLRDGRSNV
jgi:hypothetical protein